MRKRTKSQYLEMSKQIQCMKMKKFENDEKKKRRKRKRKKSVFLPKHISSINLFPFISKRLLYLHYSMSHSIFSQKKMLVLIINLC